MLVHYDPDDPTQVVLHGMRPYGDVFFIVLGLLAFMGFAALVVLPG